MQTKWATRTANIIKSGTVPEGNIRSMRQILARAINAGMASWMTGTPSCTYGDAEKIVELVATENPAVTEDQARKGAEWLYGQVFTPRGALRRTDFAGQFTERDREIIKACRENPRFDLVELYDSTQDGVRFCTLYPVYRCHGADGMFFDYVARAWQSGGNSFIVARG